MTIVVQVSDFRNNMAMYLRKLDMGDEIELKRGNKFEAKIISHPKKKILVNNVDKFLEEVKILRKKIKLKTKSKNMEELNNEIDRIVYGVDRNGKELSKDDR